MVMPQVIIPPPSVASIFQGGDEDLTSSCPTSQEPVVSVPSLFQTAGANLPLGGLPQPNPPRHHLPVWQDNRVLQGIQDPRVKEEEEE